MHSKKACLTYLELIFLVDFNSNERKIFQRLCEWVIYPDNNNTEVLSKLISQLLFLNFYKNGKKILTWIWQCISRWIMPKICKKTLQRSYRQHLEGLMKIIQGTAPKLYPPIVVEGCSIWVLHPVFTHFLKDMYTIS